MYPFNTHRRSPPLPERSRNLLLSVRRQCYVSSDRRRTPSISSRYHTCISRRRSIRGYEVKSGVIISNKRAVKTRSGFAEIATTQRIYSVLRTSAGPSHQPSTSVTITRRPLIWAIRARAPKIGHCGQRGTCRRRRLRCEKVMYDSMRSILPVPEAWSLVTSMILCLQL